MKNASAHQIILVASICVQIFQIYVAWGLGVSQKILCSVSASGHYEAVLAREFIRQTGAVMLPLAVMAYLSKSFANQTNKQYVMDSVVLLTFPSIFLMLGAHLPSGRWTISIVFFDSVICSLLCYYCYKYSTFAGKTSKIPSNSLLTIAAVFFAGYAVPSLVFPGFFSFQTPTWDFQNWTFIDGHMIDNAQWVAVLLPSYAYLAYVAWRNNGNSSAVELVNAIHTAMIVGYVLTLFIHLRALFIEPHLWVVSMLYVNIVIEVIMIASHLYCKANSLSPQKQNKKRLQ